MEDQANPTPVTHGATNINASIETLEWLAKHGAPFVNEMYGAPFSTKPLHQVRVTRPTQEAIEFPNLSSLCAYIQYVIQEDSLELEEYGNQMLHVSAGANSVEVYSEPLGPERTRTRYGVATFSAPKIHVGDYIDVEDMILMLATKFESNKDSEALISLLSSLVATQEITKSDDGLSQQVSVREGITSDRVEVNPIRSLKPYRTFPEAGQVAEKFLLRLRNQGPNFYAKLIEADSGMWKVEAIANIKKFILNFFGGDESFKAKVQLNF